MLLLPQILPVGTPEAEARRFLEAVQAVVDSADSVSFAPHVLADRLSAAPPPHLLFNMALGDMQVARFVETWLAGEVPEIADPYEALGTPPR